MNRRFTVRLRILFAVLAASMLISGFSASAALAAPRTVSPFDLNSHMLWGYSRTEITRELDAMSASGAAWLRIDVSWRGFETSKGVYDASLLGNFDFIVAEAAARGISVAPVVLAVPDWANGNQGRWTPPTNDQDFADFMRFVAARYSGKITYWELGNEVNETGFWNVDRAASPARYTAFLKKGYTGTKLGNPNAKVITAGLAGADFGYLKEMYAAGAKGYFDVVGVHPYTNGRSPYAEDAEHPGWVFGGMTNMKSVMDSYGDSEKTMWATELGWQTSTVGNFVTKDQQAQYIYDSYKRLYESFPYVTTIFVYGLRNDGTDPNAAIDNYGLMNRDFSQRPAFAAYRRAYVAFQAPAAVTPPTAAPTPPTTTTTVNATIKSVNKRVRSKTYVVAGTVARPTTTLASAPTAAAAPSRVYLQRKVKGAWVNVKAIPVQARGRFTARVSLYRGAHAYRVWAKAGTAKAAASKAITVRVR